LGCQQQHLGNVADSSERSPLSANSAKRRNSVLNPLSEEDHGSLEGIKLCFSSFIQPSFLLQSIPKTYSGKVAKENSYQLVEIYSPDLLAAQEELLQTISTAHELKDSTNTLLRERTQAMVQAIPKPRAVPPWAWSRISCTCSCGMAILATHTPRLCGGAFGCAHQIWLHDPYSLVCEPIPPTV
jgi:hypothetical protein